MTNLRVKLRLGSKSSSSESSLPSSVISIERLRIKNNCLLQCMCKISKQILLYGSVCSCITKKLFKIILNLYTCIQHTSTQPNIKRQNYIKVPGKNLVHQTCINSVPVWFHSRKQTWGQLLSNVIDYITITLQFS